MTNSTHLSQYKSQLSLYDLAKVILDIPAFDVRLAAGDPELVNIIAKNVGAINMFSLELLSIDLINDMYAESRNDDCKYAELATQEDFDRF